jgi:hypothetical protein
MFKRPQEPDLFKHFVDDPSEVKLEAWRLLQRRLTIRAICICLCALAILASSFVVRGLL